MTSVEVMREWTRQSGAQGMTLNIKDIMNRAVHTVSPDDTFDEACSLLLRQHISGLPVVDHEQRLVGIITENDLLNVLVGGGEEGSYRVADYMTADVTTVSEDDSAVEVAGMFLKYQVRRFPVLSGDRLVGIVARRDLVRYICDLRKRIKIEIDLRKPNRAAAVSAQEVVAE